MEIERKTDEWGRVILTPQGMIEFLMRGGDPTTVLVEHDELIDQYHAHCTRRDKIDYLFDLPTPMSETPEACHDRRAAQWLFEPEQGFDIRDYLMNRCENDAQRTRVSDELALFEKRGLLPLLIRMKVMVERFRANNVVWGVGRGSSVASYCLFLLGVHHIDSMKYELSISDFLK